MSFRSKPCSDEQLDGSLFLRRKKIHICSPLWATISIALLERDGQQTLRAALLKRSQLLCAAHPYKRRNRTVSKHQRGPTVIPAADGPIRHICRPSEQNVVGGSRNVEVCLCGRSNGCINYGENSRCWIPFKRLFLTSVRRSKSSKEKERGERGENAEPSLSSCEQERSEAFAKAREPRAKTCQVIAEPPPIKDVTEKAEIPRLEHASDSDHKPVEVEENLHPAPLALDDELERNRSHSYNVPRQRKRTRKKSLPQIRDQPVGAVHLPYSVMALMTDGGKDLWVSSPTGTCVELLLGRQFEDRW